MKRILTVLGAGAMLMAASVSAQAQDGGVWLGLNIGIPLGQVWARPMVVIPPMYGWREHEWRPRRHEWRERRGWRAVRRWHDSGWRERGWHNGGRGERRWHPGWRGWHEDDD